MYFRKQPIYPDLKDWPIYQITKRNAPLKKRLKEMVFERIIKRKGKQLDKLLAQTIYRERTRVKESSMRADPKNEDIFWKKLQKKLSQSVTLDDAEKARQIQYDILHTIINRYVEEIIGTFDPKVFKFARKFLTLLFNRLLNTAANRNIRRLYGTKHKLHDRMVVKGNDELLRKLFPKANIVVVPTHFSNLDSILIGYVMDALIGLPAFAYGAGLNLYSFGPAAFFMKRLGAYSVDRRKKNIVYLETLIALASLYNQEGINNIFFPGGTRSRTGALEEKLKLGLLSSVIEAQRELIAKGSDRKVVVVPVIMSYEFVLEAKHLITQYLKRTGKENYLVPPKKDDSKRFKSLTKFIWEFFSDSAKIVVSIGRPMDALGNFVDENAVSYDRFGKPVSIKDYFLNNGITVDKQRESVYTQQLAQRIVRRYHRENYVLASHLVTFVVFNLLRHHRTHSQLDLFALLRLPTEDITFSINLVAEAVSRTQDILAEMEQNGEIKLFDDVKEQPLEVIYNGIKSVGKFHLKKPLSVNKNGDIYSRDFALLYYYHNRLTGYGLSDKIKWKQLLNQYPNIYEL